MTEVLDRHAHNARTIDPDNRTLRDVFNGESCWVKYAAVHTRPFSSSVFNMMSRLSDAPVFRSTHNPDAVDALAVEAERLRAMRLSGFVVPRVLEQGREHLVLSDVGKNVSSILAESSTAARRRAILERVTDHMIEVHKAGLYHGRSVTKDLTITESGDVGMIDLEHDPIKVMPLHDAQSRDMWLLFMSAAKYRAQDPTLTDDLASRYARRGPAASADALCDNVQLVEKYIALVRPFTATLAQDSHVHAAFDMNKALHRHLNC